MSPLGATAIKILAAETQQQLGELPEAAGDTRPTFLTKGKQNHGLEAELLKIFEQNEWSLLS